MAKAKFLNKLVQSRFRSGKDIRNLLDEEKRKQQQHRRQPRYIKGVHNGQFFRIAIPPQQPLLPDLPKLPQTLVKPKAFVQPAHSSSTKTVTTPAQAQQAKARAQQQQQAANEKTERVRDFLTQMHEWWNDNWAVLILNLGSIASLIGFTRSDVLELRAYNATGSLAAVAYNLSLTPRRMAPIAWSSIFVAVNAYKIQQIMTERAGTVNMTTEQEAVYSKFFMPHGVTPKQFEACYKKAEIVNVQRGEILVREGSELQHVMLVTQGETRAQTLGRRLTAASFKVIHGEEEKAAQEQADGHAADRLRWTSGAWIGEIAFLEKYWKKSHKSTKGRQGAKDVKEIPLETGAYDYAPRVAAAVAAKPEPEHTKEEKGASTESAKSTSASEPTSSSTVKKKDTMFRRISSGRRRRTVAWERSTAMSSSKSLYTIMAIQDSTVMKWKHEDMEKLLAVSNDTRGAMTRAMTAAIVGKVINFTVSRQERASDSAMVSGSSSMAAEGGGMRPAWATWLRDWTGSGAATTVTEDVVVSPPLPSSSSSSSGNTNAEDNTAESPLGGPVKTFE